MFKKPWQILKNNMIFIQPLLFYLLLFMVALTYLLASGKVLSGAKVVLLSSLFLMGVALCAGWFHINKLGVDSYNSEDSQEEITSKTIQNIKQFFSGVGERFPKFLLAFILYAFLSISALIGLVKLCFLVLGESTIFIELPQVAQKMTTQAELINYLNTVSMQDKLIFTKWVMSVTLFAAVMKFFAILYFTVVTSEKANVLVCLWKTIKFAVLNILSCVAIVAVMFSIYMAINILTAIFGGNSFSAVAFILLMVVYLNYYVLLVFCFYNEKTKDNSDNRSEFVG